MLFYTQQFLVLHDAQDDVTSICYQGIQTAQPGPEVITAIEQAELIMLAPSNPYASILPILSLPRVQQALLQTSAPVLAITPVVSSIPITDVEGLALCLTHRTSRHS